MYILNQSRTRLCKVYTFSKVYYDENDPNVKHYVDGRDLQTSNWMRYVNCARSKT